MFQLNCDKLQGKNKEKILKGKLEMWVEDLTPHEEDYFVL